MVRSGKRAAYWPTESETLCMRGHFMSGSRESLDATGVVSASVRLGKVCDRNRESVRYQAVGQVHSTKRFLGTTRP